MRPAEWCRLDGQPRVLAVLGGGSPFTLALAQAIADDPPWRDGELVLHGRTAAALETVSGCAGQLFAESGWSVRATTDLRRATEEADVVLHQNRYGGLAWREQDERLATALGLPPDETLGPAGLAVALRTAAGQRRMSSALRAAARPVLTMTNPLGVSTGSLAAEGVDVLGLCEVPEVTRRQVASSVGLAPEELRADYTGHNHRGFWHHLSHDGNDLLEAAAKAASNTSTVLELRAVPDKYHALLNGGAHLRPGRAAELSRVRRRALEQAARRDGVLPPALRKRDMPWYRVAVLPVLRALAGSPTEAIVTTIGSGRTPEEIRVVLDGPRIRPQAQATPPSPVRELHERLHRHEAAVVAAAADPTPERVRNALVLDPMVPESQTEIATQAVLSSFSAWLAEERAGG